MALVYYSFVQILSFQFINIRHVDLLPSHLSLYLKLEEEKLKEPTYLLVQNGPKTILIRFLRSF